MLVGTYACIADNDPAANGDEGKEIVVKETGVCRP